VNGTKRPAAGRVAGTEVVLPATRRGCPYGSCLAQVNCTNALGGWARCRDGSSAPYADESSLQHSSTQARQSAGMTRPSYGPDPYRRGSALSRSFLPLALITLGVVVLLGNLASNVISDRGRGGLIVFGLGAAFAVGRLTTGRFGYAVPAGLLMALGIHIIASALDIARGTSSAGLFFILLGVGFVLVYVIGLRPASVWPLFPAAILVGLGVVLLGVASLGPLAAWSWIAAYWPAALILLGAWLLFRDALPPSVRAPLATLGGMLLLIYGVVAAAASIAAAGSFDRVGVYPAGPAADTSPFGDTLTLDAPLADGQTFTVVNTSGNTTVHASNASSVHVVATRHFAFGGQPPDVQLAPVSGGLSLGLSGGGRGRLFGDSGSVDYAIDVPATAVVKATSTSGKLSVDGVGGAVSATSTSGGISLANIGGEVRASTTSGSVTGTQLAHVVSVQSASGRIALEGVFAQAASVSASSGRVDVKLLPGSAVTLDVHTVSGSIEPRGLMLSGGVTRRDTLSGAIGTPEANATLRVQTSSGSITISQ
jgi:putative adhesin